MPSAIPTWPSTVPPRTSPSPWSPFPSTPRKTRPAPSTTGEVSLPASSRAVSLFRIDLERNSHVSSFFPPAQLFRGRRVRRHLRVVIPLSIYTLLYIFPSLFISFSFPRVFPISSTRLLSLISQQTIFLSSSSLKLVLIAFYIDPFRRILPNCQFRWTTP